MNCPDASALAVFYAEITGGKVTFTLPRLGDLGDTEQRVLRAGAAKLDFQPNSEHCLVFADPVEDLFCLTTVDELG